MKTLAFVISILLISNVSFGQTKKTISGTGNINSVSIYHTACFGRCAEYKVEVNKDGTATYTGIRFVPDSGIYTKNIGKKAAQEILASFSRYNWDTFPDRYESMVQDLPGLIMDVKYGKKTKSIQNAHFGPRTLRALTRKLDHVIERNLDGSGGIQPIDKTWRKIGNYKYE